MPGYYRSQLISLPDGQAIVYFTGPNVASGVASLAALSALRPLALTAPGEILAFSVPKPLIFLEIPPGLPGGVYWWFAALVVPGALADGSADPGDVDVIAVTRRYFVP